MTSIHNTLRILGMSWGVKNTFFETPGVSLGGSGVSIGGVKILRVKHDLEFNSYIQPTSTKNKTPNARHEVQVASLDGTRVDIEIS